MDGGWAKTTLEADRQMEKILRKNITGKNLMERISIEESIVGEIQEHMVSQEILLFLQGHHRYFFQLFEMRPSIIINTFQFIVSAG
jgi:hypothetical protein